MRQDPGSAVLRGKGLGFRGQAVWGLFRVSGGLFALDWSGEKQFLAGHPLGKPGIILLRVCCTIRPKPVFSFFRTLHYPNLIQCKPHAVVCNPQP